MTFQTFKAALLGFVVGAAVAYGLILLIVRYAL